MYNLEYDPVEDMEKTRENISLYELTKLKQQKHKLLQSLGFLSTEYQATSSGNMDKGKSI